MTAKKPRTKSNISKSETVADATASTDQNSSSISEPVIETLASEGIVSSKKNKSIKAKVIRDSFSFPEPDYRKISELKKTCLANGVHVKKSEVLRAGLYLLSQLNLDELKQVVEKVEKIKTGRPREADL